VPVPILTRSKISRARPLVPGLQPHPGPIVRKTLRLPHFDYSSNGAYFFTICTHRRRHVLVGDTLSIVEREFVALPDRFAGLSFDCWNFLPDHMHAIAHMIECRATLSAIVQAYKSITTRAIKQAVAIDRVWQRGFHDRIVRNEIELASLREYVQHNQIVHAVRDKP
jgi:REP-associated tyrosine transposase